MAALRSFEKGFFRTLLLALDRPFVHRLRSSTGKAGSPVNEVEVLVDAVIGNNGVVRGINAIKYVAEDSVLGLRVGDEVKLMLIHLIGSNRRSSPTSLTSSSEPPLLRRTPKPRTSIVRS